MKVFDLVCEHAHRFEGWFASTDQFATQQGASQVACPVCGSSRVTRAPSVPRLNLAASDAPAAKGGGRAELASMEAAAAMIAQLRGFVAGIEDVGARFAEEARRIHYDETPARPIRGTASEDERRELQDEGIETMRLALPRALTDTLQ